MTPEQIVRDHVREQEKQMLNRLCRDYVNLGNRIRELAPRVYPDINPKHDYRLDTYSLIDAL